mgnify:CR=1 FL=1
MQVARERESALHPILELRDVQPAFRLARDLCLIAATGIGSALALGSIWIRNSAIDALL